MREVQVTSEGFKSRWLLVLHFSFALFVFCKWHQLKTSKNPEALDITRIPGKIDQPNLNNDNKFFRLGWVFHQIASLEQIIENYRNQC